jgi:hypothetical protein
VEGRDIVKYGETRQPAGEESPTIRSVSHPDAVVATYSSCVDECFPARLGHREASVRQANPGDELSGDSGGSIVSGHVQPRL